MHVRRDVRGALAKVKMPVFGRKMHALSALVSISASIGLFACFRKKILLILKTLTQRTDDSILIVIQITIWINEFLKYFLSFFSH